MKQYERDINADKETNEFDLMRELQHLPSIMLYWNMEYQKAKNTAAELKTKYEYTQNRALIQITAEKTASEGKKPTENALSALVCIDNDVRTMYNTYIEAENEKNLLYVCSQVIETKLTAIKLMIELRKTEYFNANMGISAEKLTSL